MTHVRFLIALIILGSVSSASALTVGATETWSGGAFNGWQSFNPVTGLLVQDGLSISNGTLRMDPVVDPETQLDPRWSFVATSIASSGIFAGSYYGQGVHTIEFDIQSTVSATLRVQLVHEEVFGAVFNATYSLNAGTQPETISVSVDLDTFEPDLFGDDSVFETILRQTDQMWITLEWAKAAPDPVFTIDNVKLLGAGSGYGSWIDGFALGLSDSLAGADVDTDGLINGDEFNIDTLPSLSNGLFRISYNSNVVEWASSTNCQYAVLRSTNLVEGVFEPVDFIFGDGTAMQYQDTETNAAAFYRVDAGRKP